MSHKFIKCSLAAAFLATSVLATYDGPGQWYRISPKIAGKSWDLPGFNGQTGSLCTYDDDGGTDQLWYVREVWNWKRELIPRSDLNKRLDLPNGNQTDGTQLQVWNENGTDAQRFYFDDMGDQNFKIKMAPSPQKPLDLAGGNTGNNVAIRVWTDNGSDAQRWQFQNKTVATVYRDGNFGGHQIGLVHGDYNLAALCELAPIENGVLQNPNDWISSLRVIVGTRVTLYEGDNFTGASVTYYGDVAQLDAAWNDKVSSIRVQDGYHGHVDWRENFTGTTLNRNDWNVMQLPAGKYNNEWQRYEDDEFSPGPYYTLKVVDGKLRIVMRWDGGGFNGYRSARLNTKDKKHFYGGMFVARIKYNESGSDVRGLWPAFWTLGNNIDEHAIYGTPDGGACWPTKTAREMDIWEWVSNNEDANGIGHYINNGIWGNAGCQQVTQSYPDDDNYFDSDVWYEFSVRCYGGQMHFYRDNVWTHSMPDWPFLEGGQTNFVLLNMAIGGMLGGDVNLGQNGWANIEVDYVYHASHSW